VGAVLTGYALKSKYFSFLSLCFPVCTRLESQMLVLDLDPESPPMSLRIVDRASGCVVMAWHGARCRQILAATGLTPAELRTTRPGPPQRQAIRRLLFEALVTDFTTGLQPTLQSAQILPFRATL